MADTPTGKIKTDTLNALERRADAQDKHMEIMRVLTVGSTVVIMISFITLLISVYGIWADSFRFKAETYQALIDRIDRLDK